MKSSSSMPILVIIQKDITKAKEIFFLRKMRQNPKSSLAWMVHQELEYQSILEEARFCEVSWLCP